VTHTGKVVMVTGAARGIGRAIARAFADVGGRVIALDRVRPDASEPGVRDVAINLYDTPAIVRCVENIWDTYGAIHVLVNCAGMYPSKPAIAIAEDEWDAVLDLNLKVPFLLSREIAVRMIKGGVSGTVINIASTAAHTARPGVAHYCASKAGLVMLTRVLALEWAPYRIRVNAVCPGLVGTETLLRSLATPVLVQEHREKVEKIPLGRAAMPEEIARAAVMLADDDICGYVTGQTLYVDGGYTAGQTFPSFKVQMDAALEHMTHKP
jgi:NAD(P)-dependent dehydrogenase (short-subunit alcohol dehydrogenase family)